MFVKNCQNQKFSFLKYNTLNVKSPTKVTKNDINLKFKDQYVHGFFDAVAKKLKLSIGGSEKVPFYLVVTHGF